jgi:3-deoxy-D-manno-octulosonate 8-phosphate phosphatase (KDO 8-P phosphatase)
LDILGKTGLDDTQVAFMGDDIVDIPVMRRVGFAAAPADAVEEVIPHVHYIAKNRGGWGAVREVCDLLLKGQGVWETATARYFL